MESKKKTFNETLAELGVTYLHLAYTGIRPDMSMITLKYKGSEDFHDINYEHLDDIIPAIRKYLEKEKKKKNLNVNTEI